MPKSKSQLLWLSFKRSKIASRKNEAPTHKKLSYSRKMYLTIRCSILSQHGNQAVTMLCPMWLYVTLCSSAYSCRQSWDITWATHVSGLHILAWSGWDVLFLLGPPHDCSEKTLVWLHMYYVSFRLMEELSLRANLFYPPQLKLQTVKVWKFARV